MIDKIKKLISRVKAECLGIKFVILVKYDDKYSSFQSNCFKGRIYLQVEYKTPCTHNSNLEVWKGRKYYLSDYMTEDEVVKTAYVAFEQAVKHEIMEGFKVDNTILFNPHINFEELLLISHKEVKRS